MGEQLSVEDPSYGLIVVRRWHVHEPTERMGRWRFAVFLDLLLHVFVTMILFGSFLVGHPDAPFWETLLVLIGGYVAVSFVHRVFLQWWWRATLGKALLGVVLVRTDTRGRPALRRLAGVWLGASLIVAIEGVLNGL
jgi:hypothetical protein